MEQSATIGALALALSKAQGMIEGADKTSKNDFFKSKYADLHECIQAAREPLAKNELAVVQTTDTDEKGLWVFTTLVHSSGEWMRGKILMKPKKDDDQATGSSITYGRRYGFAAIVGIAQKDDDGNASTGAGDTDHKKDKIGKSPAGKPDNKAADRTILDKALAWLKGFESPGITVDQMTAAWEQQKAAIDSLPAEHLAELKAAKSKLELLLINREGEEKLKGEKV
jgi:hypothetical protein